MAFKKTIEDFTCEHCGHEVKGTGFTNHCPACLWSKHVDVDPGDRAEICGGLMEPIAVEGTVARYRILHRCTKCRKERRVNLASEDSKEALLGLAQKRMP